MRELVRYLNVHTIKYILKQKSISKRGANICKRVKNTKNMYAVQAPINARFYQDFSRNTPPV